MTLPLLPFASNAAYIAPVVSPDLGEATKVALTADQRANGWVPEKPVPAEHLNYELNYIEGTLIELLVARGLEGTALCNWAAQTSGTVEDLNAVIWSGTLFVAVGGNGTILTSPDGVTWTARTSGTAEFLNDVAWSGTLFVAVGGNGTILSSPDGITWTARSSAGTARFEGVTFGNGLFVLVGANDGTDSELFTSPDGITWTERLSHTSALLSAVVWSGTLFAAVGGSQITTSPDGITWTLRSAAGAASLSDVVWHPDLELFVAVGSGTGFIRTSPDGITWSVGSFHPKGGTGNFGLQLAEHHLLVVGDEWIVTSVDAVTWKVADAAVNLADVAWADQVAVAVGDGGLIQRSHRTRQP